MMNRMKGTTMFNHSWRRGMNGKASAEAIFNQITADGILDTDSTF